MNAKEIRIVNIVATSDLKKELDFTKLNIIKGLEYNPRRYHGIVAYFKDSETIGKVSIFKSGKMISVGTKSEEDAFHDLEHVTEVLAKRGFIKKSQINMKVRNIVALMDLHKTLDILELAKDLPNVLYEPEQFPGLIFRPTNLKDTTILVFESGKVVITGLKNPKDLDFVCEEIQRRIKEIV